MTTDITTESCATCHFWIRDGGGGAPRGLCRKSPPQLVVHGGYVDWRQPHTLQSDWCGEWLRRVNKPVTSPKP